MTKSSPRGVESATKEVSFAIVPDALCMEHLPTVIPKMAHFCLNE